MRLLLLVLSLLSAAASAQEPGTLGDNDPLAVLLGTSSVPQIADTLLGSGDEALPPASTIARVLPTETASPTASRVLTLGGVLGPDEVGGRVAFVRRPITDARWSFPVGVEVSGLLGGNGDGSFGGLLALGGAIHAARRLGSTTVYVQPGAQLSVGYEEAYYTEGPFLGGRLSLDLIRYPTRKGIVAGVGIYGTRRLGSDIYNSRALGASVTLGAQF